MRPSSRPSARTPARRRSDVPFGFLKRGKDKEPPPKTTADPARGFALDGITEDWRMTGGMMIDGGLWDALTRREPIPIVDVQWAPVEGSEPLSPATGLKSIDPYDLVLVLGASASV